MTISVRFSFVQTKGVAQPDFKRPSLAVRAAFQASFPVAASSATRNDSPSLSWSWYTRPPCTTGDDAVPKSR